MGEGEDLILECVVVEKRVIRMSLPLLSSSVPLRLTFTPYSPSTKISYFFPLTQPTACPPYLSNVPLLFPKCRITNVQPTKIIMISLNSWKYIGRYIYTILLNSESSFGQSNIFMLFYVFSLFLSSLRWHLILLRLTSHFTLTQFLLREW